MSTAIKYRPLIRNAEQVRAIQNGATQFRVPVKPQPEGEFIGPPSKKGN